MMLRVRRLSYRSTESIFIDVYMRWEYRDNNHVKMMMIVILIRWINKCVINCWMFCLFFFCDNLIYCARGLQDLWIVNMCFSFCDFFRIFSADYIWSIVLIFVKIIFFVKWDWMKKEDKPKTVLINLQKKKTLFRWDFTGFSGGT